MRPRASRPSASSRTSGTTPAAAAINPSASVSRSVTSSALARVRPVMMAGATLAHGSGPGVGDAAELATGPMPPPRESHMGGRCGASAAHSDLGPDPSVDEPSLGLARPVDLADLIQPEDVVEAGRHAEGCDGQSQFHQSGVVVVPLDELPKGLVGVESEVVLHPSGRQLSGDRLPGR